MKNGNYRKPYWKYAARRVAQAAGPHIARYGKYMVNRGLNKFGQAIRDYASRPSYRDYVAGKSVLLGGKSKMVSTPGKTSARVLTRGVTSSKSAGFLKTKKYRRTRRQKVAAKGVEATIE